MHFLNCIIYDDYQILPEPEVEVSEDIGSITEDLTKAPDPSSEAFINVPDLSLTSEGKPRT
jgi:hypothetical protein